LPSRDDRLTALVEARRIVRPGGVIVAAAISRWAPRLHSVLAEGLFRALPELVDHLPDAERTGHLTPVFEGSFTGYTHRPDELADEVGTSGLDLVELLNVEGAAAMLPDLDTRLADATEREVVLDSARATEAVPEWVRTSSPSPAARQHPADPNSRRQKPRSAQGLAPRAFGLGDDGSMAVAVHPILVEYEQFALALPEAWPDEPWGDHVVKVGKKIFVFFSGADSTEPAVTVKVPESHDHALSYPESFPTRYGLGKHGWVTLMIEHVPEEEREVLFDFVEESYRAVATKTLVKHLDAERAADDG
jgi:predicted DNA-binding protein (MmcQ/YjbR family)